MEFLLKKIDVPLLKMANGILPWKIHQLIQLGGITQFKHSIENKLANDLEDLARSCGFTVIESFSHFFNPGISIFLVIAESHIALHTWPEKKIAYCEIMSCSLIESLQNFLQGLVKLMGAEESIIIDISYSGLEG